MDVATPAHVRALVAARVVALGAEPLLRELAKGDAEFTSTLQPRSEDYAALFDAGVAGDVEKGYEAFWKAGPRVRPGPEYSELDIVAAPAGMLASDNELSREFPRGYRAIAAFMRPEPMWLCWRYRAPQRSTGVSFDGLAWVAQRWVWCPKPYSVIGQSFAGKSRA